MGRNLHNPTSGYDKNFGQIFARKRKIISDKMGITKGGRSPYKKKDFFITPIFAKLHNTHHRNIL